MYYIIVVFRSRDNAIEFKNFLSANGVYSSIVNTPRQLSNSCGLSLKTECSSQQISQLRNEYRGSGLVEIYAVNGFGENKIYSPIH